MGGFFWMLPGRVEAYEISVGWGNSYLDQIILSSLSLFLLRYFLKIITPRNIQMFNSAPNHPLQTPKLRPPCLLEIKKSKLEEETLTPRESFPFEPVTYFLEEKTFFGIRKRDSKH